ncbi:MAG: hypothetical protein WBV94_20000 [Blastocatellia bacterium]
MTILRAAITNLSMSAGPLDDLQQRVHEFARATEAPEESFLMRRFSPDDRDQVQSIIDGLTLSLISYCYHRHPRGENVHEVMEKLDSVDPDSDEARELESRADDAAALQIPFIVTLNRMVEQYHDLRRHLEDRLNEK